MSRHDKWVRVEPGTVIPAGQPYRWEWPDKGGTAATERVCGEPDYEVPANVGRAWFIDSTWSPPLELPTEPTWGILVARNMQFPCVGRWRRRNGELFRAVDGTVGWRTDEVLDFIPLTPEQVARIEAKR